MQLVVICPKVTKEVREIVEKLAVQHKLGNYDLIDPVSHDINKFFPAVLVLGTIPFEATNAKVVERTHLPSFHMSAEEKWQVSNAFKTLAQYIKGNEDPSVFKRDDIPDLSGLDLHSWLKEKNAVFQVKLNDHRLMGIYPDGTEFYGKYDIEVHYSTLVNVEKLFTLLNAKEVLIRD